jgi:hypothetical protein
MRRCYDLLAVLVLIELRPKRVLPLLQHLAATLEKVLTYTGNVRIYSL